MELFDDNTIKLNGQEITQIKEALDIMGAVFSGAFVLDVSGDSKMNLKKEELPKSQEETKNPPTAEMFRHTLLVLERFNFNDAFHKIGVIADRCHPGESIPTKQDCTSDLTHVSPIYGEYGVLCFTCLNCRHVVRMRAFWGHDFMSRYYYYECSNHTCAHQGQYANTKEKALENWEKRYGKVVS